jgi:menaquinol-cytochrome c reductase iron-sulfur subunit
MPEIPDPTKAEPAATGPHGGTAEGGGGVSRRKFYAIAANGLGALIALVVAVPGVAYLLDPLRRKARGGELRALPVTLKELPVGVPRQFPIIDERQDAWVQYPPEPVGSVWLVRESEGPQSKVVAFTSECPHLGCAINLSADGQSFFCPCHASAFKLDGERLNETPPRGMDTLEVEVPADESAPIRVKFQRFRTQSEEKIPLV